MVKMMKMVKRTKMVKRRKIVKKKCPKVYLNPIGKA